MAFYLRAATLYLWVFVCSILAFPLAIFRLGNPENNSAFAHLFGRTARAIMGVRVDIHHAERILALEGQSFVMVANHQHALDVVTLSEIFPKRALIIGKRELLLIPFWGFMFAAFGNLLIDRSNRTQSVQALKDLLPIVQRKRASIFLFPEGTRNRALQGLLPFKRGAFHLANEARIPILPVVSSSVAPLLDKNRGLFETVTMKVQVLEPVFAQNYADLTTCMNDTRERMLAALKA